MKQRVCAICYGGDLIVQDSSNEMVYCVNCSGFAPYVILEDEETKRETPNTENDFLLALKLAEEDMMPIPVKISHDLCTHHCPHCGICIIVEQMNCRIFRCGEGINPHASEEEALAIVKTKKNGCGKQFRIDENNKIHKCTGL